MKFILHALMGRKDYAEAAASFQKVVDYYPENKPAKNSITVANKLQEQEKAKIKKKYSGMFQKFVEEDSQVRLFISKAYNDVCCLNLMYVYMHPQNPYCTLNHSRVILCFALNR